MILISPFLRLNDRIKELLEDKNRLKIDIRIVYGKSDLRPEEIKWMQKLDYVRVSFCKNLHAKCYMNEKACIISSLNLYEFSQVNNNEMGIFIERETDDQVFKDAYEESQRIIRISEEIRISLDEVKTQLETASQESNNPEITHSKLTSSKLAVKHKIKTNDLLEIFMSKGYLVLNEKEKHQLTDLGKSIDAEFKSNSYGGYFLWPEDIQIN